jgi:hypothetical protein
MDSSVLSDFGMRDGSSDGADSSTAEHSVEYR